MNNNPSSLFIQSVVVNHNTSKYTELMLRSLFARHPSDLDMSIIILDNNSQDDRTQLESCARRKDVPIIPSGYEIKMKWNSHGEILSKFVLEHPNCTYYLFLDADTCFIEDNTIDTMIEELEKDANAFGTAPRITSNGDTEIEPVYWEKIYASRLHPCCALVKNTAVFRDVIGAIGLSCVQYLWAEGEEYLDTFELASKVMKTHGKRHLLSSKMVLHFFSVSYDWEPQPVMKHKTELRDKYLEKLCALEDGQ